MKFNWGVKIIVVYAAFVVFMLSMVYMCTRQHFDLVASDYYAQELKYQDVIDGSNNTRDLGESIKIEQDNAAIDILLPSSQTSIENGQAYFYRPSDASKDFAVDFNSNHFEVDKSKLTAGLYKVKLSWSSSGKSYFEEQSLQVGNHH